MADRKIDKSYENMPKFGRQGMARQRFAPTEKPKNAKGTLRRFLKLLLSFRGSILISAFLTVLSAGVSLLVPYLLGKAINTFDIHTNAVHTALLITIIIALVSCYLFGWAMDTVSGYLMAGITQKLVKTIRGRLFSKLQSIPLQFYNTRAHGDTMSRITNDVDNISNTVSQATTQLISSIVTFVGAVVMMLILSPLLTLAAMVTIPLFLLLTKTIASRSKRYFLRQQQTLGALSGAIEETIMGLKMVKAFSRQETVLSNFEQVNGALRETSEKAQIWSGFLMPFMNVINNLSYALIACLGGVLSVRGTVTIGVVVSFLTYSRQFGQPLNTIAGMFNNIQSALAGAERVFELMDEAEEPPDLPDAEDFPLPMGEVRFQDVSFSYTPGVPVLKQINFTVHPGEVIALVGETGAGKTTVVNLLTRFYEPDEGEIFIDGREIRTIPRDQLRRCFSVVLQDTCLFTGTIFDNIKYAKPDAGDREVLRAAKLAHADAFISRLPKGYKTAVTGSADTLSQGQRQLIAIARAILCRAPILILDEATSSVDTKTEKEIQLALRTLMKNHTSFFIAHRLSTIRDADRILVIGGGEILESGTHQELMLRKGPYYKMVRSQMGYEMEEASGSAF